jgi:hypothetical protein
MAKATFGLTIDWLKSQLLLEIDGLRTIHGQVKRESNPEVLKLQFQSLVTTRSRTTNYAGLLDRMTRAPENSAEVKMLTDASLIMKHLLETISMTIAVTQVEMQRHQPTA